MRTETFLFEKDGYKVSKLKVFADIFFIVQCQKTGRTFIRKSLTVVNEIIKNMDS